MFEFKYKTENYASHQPILYYYVNKIKNGKIIEFGVGDYSTELLHYICQKNNNILYSIESDKTWLDKISQKYPGYHWHHYIHVQDYTDLLDINFNFESDLTFIDGYTWGTRLFCLKETKNVNHNYIIVHDCDFLTNKDGHNNYIEDINFKVIKNIWPPTLICSKYNKLNDTNKIDFTIEKI